MSDSRLEHDEYVAAIRADGSALATAAARAGIDAPVPSCPEWTVADLLGHIGRIHRWIASGIVDRATDRDTHWSQAEPPPADERVEWFAAGVPLLADALAEAGPDVELWSWTPDKTTWVLGPAPGARDRHAPRRRPAGRRSRRARRAAARRRRHRRAVRPHSLLAVGRSRPWLGRDAAFPLHRWQTANGSRSSAPAALVVTREHAKGDVAARGTASDLLLFLYGRAAVDRLEVLGDASLLARWRELVAF